MQCPECKSDNILLHKELDGQGNWTWCRCVKCGLKFNEKSPMRIAVEKANQEIQRLENNGIQFCTICGKPILECGGCSL